MEKLDIYCFTTKNYKLLDYLPKNIIPVGLGNNDFSKNYLVETSGQNISKFNKYFAELTGIYWVYKNKLSHYNDNDYIGFCHYRRLWLDGLYAKNHKINSNVFSKLLNKKLEIFDPQKSPRPLFWPMRGSSLPPTPTSDYSMFDNIFYRLQSYNKDM